MQPNRPGIVIVGGGFGGVAAARALRKAEADVVVIDKHNHHLFQPLLYQVASAALHPGTIAAPIRSILHKQENCTVLLHQVNGIDLEAQKILVGKDSYTYDYLILAAGLKTYYHGHDEWQEFAPGLKSIEEATDIRARFLLAFEQAEIEQDEDAKRAALTFVIAGAGPTGVELAGALAEVARAIREEFRSIDTATARIILLDMADRVLPTFPPELSMRAQVDLEELDVEVIMSSRVIEVDAKGLSAETPMGIMRIDSNNVVWAAGVRGSRLGGMLGAELDSMGRVMVREDLSVPGYPNVFVVGDLAHQLNPKSGKPVPPVAQGALQGGKFVGKTITSEVRALQKGHPTPLRGRFKYQDRGLMAIIGRNRAVAQIGKLRIAGYNAFLLWALIHILFLIDFRRKLIVFTEWITLYFWGARGARLITGKDRIPKIVEPPPDTRGRYSGR
jgi:NADH dehydrogenase